MRQKLRQIKEQSRNYRCLATAISMAIPVAIPAAHYTCLRPGISISDNISKWVKGDHGWQWTSESIISNRIPCLEHMGNKGICNIQGSNSVRSRDKNTFLGEVVNDHQDCSVSIWGGQLFYEVHASWVPWMLWDWERLQEAMRMAGWGFIACTEDTLGLFIIAISTVVMDH